jgi:D-alanyl-lipoteichoic acid acyltransferase DltB (MBOAT superfamily)
MSGEVEASPMLSRRPVLLILGGLGVALVALGADLVGIGGKQGFGPRQSLLLGVGLTLIVVGILIDSVWGSRAVGSWFRGFHSDWAGLGKFLIIVVQLGLLVLVIRRFQLENQAFYHNILLLTFFGFLVHHFLPPAGRLPFLLLLSLGGISGVFGLSNGAWFIGLGLGLIGISRLPVPFLARVVLLLLFGVLLALLRAGLLPSPVPEVIWPILASMFMFRLIIYMYDLRHQKQPGGILTTLAYFFLLPNLVFPFFPVIDYSTFCRSHFSGDRYRIYQRGVAWMLRGVIHLVLYRLVYHHLVMAPEDVVTMADLVRFLVSNFLLYLRISGMFHLVVGMLHLFGFDLPETNHLYCLSTSFTDFWRRINIYWKDFMQKVFFFPLFFRLRGRGLTQSLVIATLFVFLVTWALHAYQWFWIRGTYLLTAPDVLFWTVLGIFVVVNLLIESKYGRERSLEKRDWSVGSVFSLGLRTVGTFSVVCILWSLWTSETLSEWVSLWAGIHVEPVEIALLVVALLAFAIVSGSVNRRVGGVPEGLGEGGTPMIPFGRHALQSGLLILALMVVGSTALDERLGPRAQRFVRDLKSGQLSERDEALMVRGYYEDLTNVNRFNSQLWEIYTLKPHTWPNLWDVGAVKPTGDFLRYELHPFLDISFKGRPLRTNRWGMRDREYERDPPSESFRIALTGGSHAMGSGVADQETFESVLEERLNRDQHDGSQVRYEVLNFGVDGYNPIQQLVVLERKVIGFQPHAHIYVAHSREGRGSISFLAERMLEDVEIPFPYLENIIRESGLNPGMTKEEAFKSLRPYQEDIVVWFYRKVVEICQEHDIHPLWVFLPDEVGSTYPEEVKRLERIAREAGFTVFDLSDVYGDQDVEILRVAAWDFHPNEKGHALIAEELHRALLETADLLPPPPP